VLAAYGETVGSLRFVPPRAPLRARDRQLLDDLAGHLGGVLHALRLTADVRLARERLVLAREEERRRLRRDLHDGLGPALAGHLLRLDLLVGRLRGHDAAADADRLRDDLRGTVAEVRRVVEGLRPPALDELGLVGALQQVTRRMTAGSSITVCLEDRVLPPLSAAVEVAAFRIVTEAVTNVVKHAEATTCRIELRAVHGRLCISVDDDGNGGAVARARSRGHGMQTMAERAEELRGEVRVTAGRPCGTRVTAELPLPPAPVVPRQYPPAEVIR
jgi:signal transduction histidine kinase